jgi:hypothetical protein
MHTSLKIVSLAALTLAFSAGTAFAGEGKDCDHKKKAAMKTQATTAQQSAVLSASETGATMAKAEKKAKKVYSFEDATKLCVDKGVTDLQACIDYKTGAKAHMKPKS